MTQPRTKVVLQSRQFSAIVFLHIDQSSLFVSLTIHRACIRILARALHSVCVSVQTIAGPAGVTGCTLKLTGVTNSLSFVFTMYFVWLSIEV